MEVITGPLDRLESAAGAISAIVDGIGDGQWELPTPCTEWDVAALLAHVTAGNWLFARAVGGDARARSGGMHVAEGQEETGGKADFRASVAELLGAFAETGALERVVAVPFGSVPGAVAVELRVTELLTHGWDLAAATGQEFEVSDDVALSALAFSESAIRQVPPDRSPFAPPQPVAEGAAPLERLAPCWGAPSAGDARRGGAAKVRSP